MKRKLRMGMIGGGRNSFIGAIHRIAANIDGLIELSCGALSSNADNALESGRTLFLPGDKIYTSYEQMIEQESMAPADQRMDFVSIVTPNHLHFEPAMMALDKGFHVIIDKPVTFSLAEAKELKSKVEETGLLFGLTHTYTGYPMVKQARQMVREGMLGRIRKVHVEYPQGWLTNALENTENKQANWRTDPGKSGIAGAMGDIGTHAFNLAEYVSGLEVVKICADLNIVVAGRRLDDDGAVLLKFNNGASGTLMATQVAAGAENNIKIAIYGELGGIEWQQEDANSLVVKWLDKPAEVYRAGTNYIGSFAKHNTRILAGHPEGYLEAFANIYRNFALSLDARMCNQEPTAEMLDFPGCNEGIRGMSFIENVVASGKSDLKWTAFS
ncbi:MAG: Gfo/Idh/MocA family oxidoreductase [Bacteroidota bacterium]